MRTIIDCYGKSLRDVPAPALGAVIVREVLQRSGVDPLQVETAVMGNVIPARAKMNLARPDGFEPPTPWFVARYSIQLSYGRIKTVKSLKCKVKRAYSFFFSL